MNGRLLGREPVVTVSTVVALLIAVLPVFGWSSEVVGTVAAALVVLGGAVEAALVSVDRVLPLLVGVGKAVLSVLAAFSIHLPDNYVSTVMALLTVVAGLTVRQQVGAPQRPRDRQGRPVVYPSGAFVEMDDMMRDAPPIPDRGPDVDRGEFIAEPLPPVEHRTPREERGVQDQYGGQHSRTDLWPDGFGDLSPRLS